MNKHNCLRWFSEGQKCSICKCLLQNMSAEKIKSLQTYVNQTIKNLENEVMKLKKQLKIYEEN